MGCCCDLYILVAWKRKTQNASSGTQITFSQNAAPKRKQIAGGAPKTQTEADQNANSKRKCHMRSKMKAGESSNLIRPGGPKTHLKTQADCERCAQNANGSRPQRKFKTQMLHEVKNEGRRKLKHWFGPTGPKRKSKRNSKRNSSIKKNSSRQGAWLQAKILNKST